MLCGAGLKKDEVLRRVGNIDQIAWVRRSCMTEGRADGLRTVDMATGSGLELLLLEGRCLDIGSMRYKGVNLSFLAKPGFTAPQYFNPHGEFGRTFQAGMLYTCGLSNAGSGCTVDGMDYCIHGRISTTPAEKVSVSCGWKDDSYLMQVSGEMKEAALFSENLVLKRTVSTSLGARSVTIHDEVENRGFEDQALMILYHFNAGYPLVDDGSTFLAPSLKTIPRDAAAEPGLGEFDTLSAPVDGYREQVFYHEAAAAADGTTCAALFNRKLGMGIYIKYNVDQLPRLIQWKSMASGDYTVGIEPANCLVGGRAEEKKNGTLRYLKPMEKAVFELEIGVAEGEREMDELAGHIKALKG